MFHVERAARWFPLDHRFRSGVAEFYSIVRWKGSRAAAIDALTLALETNPFSLDLRRNLAALLWENGEQERAEAELLVIKALSPKAKLTIVVNVNPGTN